ncbi:MAG: recombinase family protein, partial [Flavobacteriales bacterium]
MKAAVYCRTSREKDHEDKSLADQEALGKKYCEEQGFKCEVYKDEGFSGTLFGRPEFNRMIEDIREGEISHVWAYDDTRIQRDPSIWSFFVGLINYYEVKFVTETRGEVDLDNDENQLIANIFSHFNKYFVQLTKRKIKGSLDQKIKRGEYWGKVPYGYYLDEYKQLQINPEEKDVVENIFYWSLEGYGTGRIAEFLNNKGVATRYNGYEGTIKLNKSKGRDKIKEVDKKDVKWASNTVLGILKNPVYYGEYKINDTSLSVPSIISYSYWLNVNLNLKNRIKNNEVGTPAKYHYLLTKTIKCKKCGRNYAGKSRKDKKDHHYFCMSKRYKLSCGNRGLNIDALENLVWSHLFRYKHFIDNV